MRTLHRFSMHLLEFSSFFLAWFVHLPILQQQQHHLTYGHSHTHTHTHTCQYITSNSRLLVCVGHVESIYVCKCSMWEFVRRPSDVQVKTLSFLWIESIHCSITIYLGQQQTHSHTHMCNLQIDLNTHNISMNILRFPMYEVRLDTKNIQDIMQVLHWDARKFLLLLMKQNY